MATSRERILVIEDEADILELIRYNLAKEGYCVTGTATGEEGVRMATAAPPDLVILDLMLPGINGLNVCRVLKRDPRTGTVPVVIVTAKDEEADVVAGLDMGADDYVTKPFGPKVLVARIRAVLRRPRIPSRDEQAPMVIDEVVIDPARHEVTVQGRPVSLTFTEFRILLYLAARPGRVRTRYQIVEAARGDDADVTDRSVDVHIVGLRRKLGAAGPRIETIRGVGYRLRDWK
ncbi:MAG: response regulator transcription factor [Candidatus Schekmanbacteria bacterium]|nr:response regulator transcription factor [Candidatus Schekmanbacteria bacterium]